MAKNKNKVPPLKKRVKGPQRKLNNQQSSGFNKRASFRTKTTYSGLISIPASATLFRVDVLPALGIFPIAKTALRWQTYKATRISYHLIPRFNISSVPGSLPMVYSIPVQNNNVPLPTVAAFTNFANVKVDVMDKKISGSFSPYMYTSTDDTTVVQRSPIL